MKHAILLLYASFILLCQVHFRIGSINQALLHQFSFLTLVKRKSLEVCKKVSQELSWDKFKVREVGIYVNWNINLIGRVFFGTRAS